MTNSNNMILYVADAARSRQFYSDVLNLEAVEASESFAMFLLPSGLALGLWQVDKVQPAAMIANGGSELGFKLADVAAVNRCYQDWAAKGLAFAMPPTELEFGTSFVALDPDGHRLRVYTMAD